jgi:DNA-binding transcriptional LysR family regulator
MDIDLRLVRYFLVMAEELHFTAAARRLYISQPGLSNQIRRLERQLGFELFERSARGVTLTPAGEAFLPHAREMLAALQSGLGAAAAADGAAVLRLDLLESSLETPRAVLAQVRDRLPSVRLDVTSHGSVDQQRRLLSGDLDLGLCGAGAPLGTTLAEEVVRREPVGVALPVDHRLSALDEVPLADLAEDPQYLPRDDFAPEWNAFVLDCCQAAGFTLHRHPAGTDGTDIAMDLVRAGECVALSLMSTSAPEGTVVRRLAGPLPLYSWVIRWRRSESTSWYVDAAREAVTDLAVSRSWLS